MDKDQSLLIACLAITLFAAPTHLQASEPFLDVRSDTNAAADRGADGRLNAEEVNRLIEVANRTRVNSMNVVLDIEWTPEGYLTEEAAVAQRRQIAFAQAKVLTRLSQLGLADDIWKYKYIPMLDVGFSESIVHALDELPIVKRLEIAAATGRPATHDTAAHIEADVLWNTRGVDGTGWVVALLDTGVTPAHSALYGKIVAEACFSTHKPSDGYTSLCFGGDTSHPQYPTQQSTAPESAVDCGAVTHCGHGTKMAGLIVADGGGNFKGMAFGATLIAIQTYTKNTNNTAVLFKKNVAQALEHVYGLRNTYNIAAVNLSMIADANFYSSACDTVHSGITAAAANLRSVGIIPVAAAGNESNTTSIRHPACISHVVAVGAVETLPPSTVWSGSNSSPLLELWSPPGNGEITTDQSGGTVFAGGTSSATAVASAAVALLRSGYPGWVTTRTILDAIKSSGIPVTDNRNGVTRPRIALDLALPPTELFVSSFPCFGGAYVTWGGSMPDLDSFRVYSSPYPFPDVWHPEWLGTSTSANVSVNQDSYIGVQAVKGNRFGGVHGSFEIAYGPCL